MEKALNQFQDNVKHKQILLRTDNSKVVSYINRKGGTKSVVLYLLAWRILHWWRLWAAHIPTKRNAIADQLSRRRQIPKMRELSL